jgi:hypothetical protein
MALRRRDVRHGDGEAGMRQEDRQIKRIVDIAASRRWKLGLVSGLIVVASASAAAIALASVGSSGFTALGPYYGSNLQVPGSCGNNYAIQNFQTSYRVYPQRADGSYVVEQISEAQGKTEAGSSLEACASGSNNGATTGAGIPVTTDYRTLDIINGATFNPSGHCSSQCFFGQFIPAFFGTSGSITSHQMSTINTYQSPCNGAVVEGSGGVLDGDITGTLATCSEGHDH